ncbi:oxidoreductase [Rhodoferax koreense]|uniref:Oxidoreductase n=1 Tax=Rhodoferax koreensis TaxID=1842727 RepID=A0A1P8JR74_9BURK|nr:Gfo/Idh/MocA family oxidoreductase [Rhodoferax koreense]APW36264.1 oxidoreductase [Rhodoferax koreense]
MSDRTIRWGMIGCGDVAEVKSGPAFYKAENSELVAVMRRNGALAEDFARRHGVGRWHDNAEAIIQASDIDAVYIATTTDSHHDYTLRCAAAGKAVYVEKPMGMSHAQCLAMVAACERAGVPLWVGFYRRALPRFLQLRDILQSGVIGEVRAVVSRQNQKPPTPEQLQGHFVAWRTDAARSGGGFFFEAIGHTFDIFDFLFGPIAQVQGIASNQAGLWKSEDMVTASYRFASGVLGSGAWCFAADRDEEYHDIIGSLGRIRFSVYKPVPMVLTVGDKVEEIPVADPPHVHQPLVQTIVDELNGQGRCPSTGDSGARTGWVLDEILKDFRRD